MDRKIFLLFILSSLFLFHQVKAQSVTDVAQLQSYLRPEKYYLNIVVGNEIDRPIFTGSVKIRVSCLEETNKLVLNAKNMDTTNYEIQITTAGSDGRSISPPMKIEKSYFADNVPDVYVLELQDTLKKGSLYNVRLPISSDQDWKHSEIREQILYDYRNNWQNNDQLQVITRIGPNKASLLFPCFQELEVKSKFIIKITTFNRNVKALSNWPASQRTHGVLNQRGEVTFEFEETEPMYVSGVSFALIDLQSIRWLETEEDPSDTAFTIWVNENVIEKMAEAMQATKNALKFYSDYFNAPLYAKTLDIIAVPKFHNGDTEKFGLISLEESTLAFPVNDGRQKYFDLTRELCFAMSRQWIGTSVTMSNLGERYFHHALSYFLEKLCMNEVNPHSDFNFYDLRDVITFSRVLMADYDTKLYSEFESAFNYKLPEGNTKKAFRLFKMLDFILSEKTFQQSLQIYLKMYEHSFSTLDDLWKMFTIKARDNGDLEESMSVEEIMHNWVNENRFPLVRVNIDYVSKIMTLSQEPFKFLGDEQNDAEKVYWNIPLSFKFQSDLDNHSPFLNTMPRFFNEGVETFGLRLDHKDWIIVNPQLNALSHTYYDNDSWGNIQDVLLNPKTFSQIDELTRAHLTLDLFALAEAAVVPYERVFHTMKYLKHEISELCWTIALIEFDKIYSYLLAASSELTKKFENYMKGILGPVFNSVSDDEKNGKSSQQDNLNEESFDEPPNTEPQNTKAALDNTDLNAESEKLSDDSSERDEKFDQLFDVPVRIDEIKRNNRLKMEFLKLFVRSSCKFMVAECGDQSIALFKEWKKGYEDEDAIQRRIPIEIRETVLCYAIQNLSQRDWLFVWDQYVNAKEEKETDIILKALGCSNVKGVLDFYWEKTLEKSYYGDNLKAFLSMSSSKIGYPKMKKFLTGPIVLFNKGHRKFRMNLGPKKESLHHEHIKWETYFVELFNITAKREDMEDLIAFMEQEQIRMRVNISDELVQKSMKRAKRNVLWLENYEGTVSELLKDY